MICGGRDGFISPVLALALLLGQGTTKPESLEAVDPYTRGEAKALEKLGYATLSPIEWAQGIKVAEVKETLGGIEVLWIETEHFKIASTLESYKSPSDPKEDDRLEADLGRLKKKLARYKAPGNKLDPWMRAHLYAQRLEELYAGFERTFGLSAADFPGAEGKKPADAGKLGLGPYLGLERKFTVLLAEKSSTLGRFAQRYMQREERPWDRFPLPGGSMFAGVSADGMKQYGFQFDVAMHCLLASEVTHNFVNGFQNSWSASPLWLECGLAHTAARAIDERFVPPVMGPPSTDDPDAWKWEPRVRGLIDNKVAKPWASMLAWKAFDELKMQDHLLAWSRASWLLQQQPPAALRNYLVGVTEALPEGLEGDALAAATLEREKKACEKAFGKSIEALEADWKKHVERKYPKN